MTERARRWTNARETEAAYEALPEGTPAAILDGELFTLPRPRPEHQSAATRLAGDLDGPFHRARGGPGGWVILAEPELHLGARPDKMAPDLAGWRRERMPEIPSTPAITSAPDWICEVLSESTEALDRGRKARIYRREGVRHYWLVSPALRTLEVMRRNDQGRWEIVETYEGDQRVRAEPFEAIEIELGALWAR